MVNDGIRKKVLEFNGHHRLMGEAQHALLYLEKVSRPMLNYYQLKYNFEGSKKPYLQLEL